MEKYTTKKTSFLPVIVSGALYHNYFAKYAYYFLQKRQQQKGIFKARIHNI